MHASSRTRQIDALTASLGQLFGQIMRSATSNPFELLGQLDLTVSQAKTLMVLTYGGAVTVGTLAERTLLSPAAASRVVESLHRAGLVERTEDEVDRRIKRVAVTAQGRALVERIQETRLGAIRELVGELDDAQRAQLAEALAPLLARIACADRAATRQKALA